MTNRCLKDMTGKQFGYLTVLYRAPTRTSPSGNQVTRWHCQCVCGKELDVDAYALRSGNTKSCGCKAYENRIKNITGQRFGKLEVTSLYKIKDKKTYWECVCDCGNKTVVTKSNLLNGNCKSCGCLRSVGESNIQKWFDVHDIKYVCDYTFDDLRGPNGGCLIFDFAILNNENKVVSLLEYQGVQHYVDMQWFGSLQRNLTDKQKRIYCKEHNIILHEIRFDEDLETALSNYYLPHADPVPSELCSKV